MKKSLGFDVEHWLGSSDQNLGDIGGDSGRNYNFKARVGYKKDLLKDYLKTSKKLNHKMIVYLNVHWFRPEFGADKFIRDARGGNVTGYGSGNLVCPAGPFLEWAKIIAEDLGRYAIQGVFLDGPVYRLCYCESCKNKFKEKYGIEMPENITHASENEKKYLREFPVSNLVNFLNCFRKAFNMHNPEGIIYHNGETLSSPGFANEAAIEVDDILGSEGGFLGYDPLRTNFFFNTSATAKLLNSQARGKPTVVFIDYGFKKYDYYGHPEPEIGRMYAETIANNANPWFLWYELTPGTKIAVKMNKLIQENREVLSNTKSLAKVAVLYSGLNQQLTAQKRKISQDDVHSSLKTNTIELSGNHFDAFMGIYTALTRSQVVFDLITEKNLETKLNDYQLLVLPQVLAMDEYTITAIKEFVKNGGNLIATFDTSLYTAEGNKRDDFGLRELFGCNAGEMAPTTMIDYISADNNNFLTNGISQSRIPCPPKRRYVKPQKYSRELMFYYKEMPRRYLRLANISEKPAALLNTYGKGKVLFFPEEIDSNYIEFCFPEERQLISNAVNYLAPRQLKFNKGLNFIETTLMQNEKGQILIHLINLSGAERPVENIIPFENLEITYKTGKKIKNVYAALNRQVLKFKILKNQIVITLPKLDHYEIVVLS